MMSDAQKTAFREALGPVLARRAAKSSNVYVMFEGGNINEIGTIVDSEVADEWPSIRQRLHDLRRKIGRGEI